MNKSKLDDLIKRWPALPGINGKEEFFNSAVIALLLPVNGEYHFVFQKRSASIRQGGEICFPGGKFDPTKDADFKETALRETVEELGVSPEKISVIGPLDTIISIMGTTVDAFLGVLDISSLDELNINSDEVERIFSVPVSYFENNEPELYQVSITAHPSFINQAGEEIVLFPTKELGLPERYTRPWGNIMNNVFVYRVAGEVIWGITARLIRDVIGRIKA